MERGEDIEKVGLEPVRCSFVVLIMGAIRPELHPPHQTDGISGPRPGRIKLCQSVKMEARSGTGQIYDLIIVMSLKVIITSPVCRRSRTRTISDICWSLWGWTENFKHRGSPGQTDWRPRVDGERERERERVEC